MTDNAAATPDSTPDFSEAETGRRHPAGVGGRVITATCLLWSLFQLWYASPLPFVLHIGVFNDTEARSIHLAFAVFLGYLAFPALKGSPRDRIPPLDWLLALAAAFSAGYLCLFYAALAQRAGLPTSLDLVVAGAGMLLLLEAARRTLGPPLTVVAGLFLFYTLAGPWMPEVIAHKGASLQRLLSHQWLGTEGVFGVALGVSTGFVFLFVLFGALLEQAGAGHWFINVAYALLGHMRGGPAKAAVVASGLSGIISGSSIANVVTTGTFTIPLMKRVGFPATKAGAVEVAASTNGQLTPPVMGAAAFLMVEYVGISYLEVIKHALLPALISYIALLYIVHLEAVKAGMQGVARPGSRWLRLAGLLGGFVGSALFGAVAYVVLGWLHGVLGPAGPFALAVLGLFGYVGLVAWSAGVPSPEEAPPLESGLPPLLQTLRSGLYFLLPVGVLIWCLAVARLSPGLAAFWGTCFMIFIVVTHRPLRRLFRAVGTRHAWHAGLVDLRDALVHGARNMIGIGVATATAGIVVGTVTLTGIGLVMTEFVGFVSGGNLLLMLLFTALISLLLGMGLPTTANYIVVSTLMAPVIVELGAEHGLVVPLIAVHLFVFYFGILADDTPPVGLAAFAAAAIAKADPIKTGVQGFLYDIRTAILPFMFIFNTELLLIGITSVWHLVLTVAAAIGAMLCFAAATQGFWLTRSRWWESVALALAAFSLFRPGFWWDQLYPPQVERPPTELVALAGQVPANGRLMVRAAGETLDGDFVTREVSLPLGAVEAGMQRLEDAGLMLRRDGDDWLVDGVTFGSPAQQAGLDLDWRIEAVVVKSDRPDKQWVYVPALGLVLLLAWGQRRRSRAAV
jgi:TRAP transporter 4TM/12TM fusion protein